MEFLLQLIAELFAGEPTEAQTPVMESVQNEETAVQVMEETPVTEPSINAKAPNFFNVIQFH